jgi:hypothetical protein
MTFLNLKPREASALQKWNLLIKVFSFTLLGILLQIKILSSPTV